LPIRLAAAAATLGAVGAIHFGLLERGRRFGEELARISGRNEGAREVRFLLHDAVRLCAAGWMLAALLGPALTSAKEIIDYEPTYGPMPVVGGWASIGFGL